MISLLLGVAGNAAYAVLLRVADVPRPTEILLTVVLLLILPFSLLHSRQFGKHGFANIWDSKLEKFNLLNQIQSSKKSLFFLGVSARTIMQPQIESAILQKLLTNYEYEIRCLLFDQNETAKLRRRAIEETGDPDAADEWFKAMGSTIEMILRIKKKLGAAGDRLQVRIYKSFPVFRMLIVDHELVLMNYYAKNRFPGDLPCLEIRGPQDPARFGYAFSKFFDEMWSEAELVKSQGDPPLKPTSAAEKV